MPARAESIKRDEFSFTSGQKRNWLDSLLRAGLIEQALAKGQSTTLEQYHYDFWQGERGHQYHSERQNRFEEIFLRHYAYLVDEINALVQTEPGYTTLCEIGSGSGQLLDYLAANVPAIERCIGIDLSEETTKTNQQTYSNPKLEFVAAGGLEWVEAHGQPNWIYLTHGGVLEYFSQENLELLLNHIGQTLAPAIFIAIEPVAVDHNLATELDSKPYGREFAFSHNYPHLFDKAHFHLKHMMYSHERLGHYLYAFVAVTNDSS
ncbi:class I SAM-dependent methyltransferase [Chloroflexi bacterium TSY]|nr:class I SAM-dependent methyltransferase [Chloroflexi bacterium TSY]